MIKTFSHSAIGSAFGNDAEDACLKLLENDAVASAYNIAE